eukprot:SAG31_NODE_3339_length_4386_cov_39.128528_6_plen_127_part_00
MTSAPERWLEQYQWREKRGFGTTDPFGRKRHFSRNVTPNPNSAEIQLHMYILKQKTKINFAAAAAAAAARPTPFSSRCQPPPFSTSDLAICPVLPHPGTAPGRSPLSFAAAPLKRLERCLSLRESL